MKKVLGCMKYRGIHLGIFINTSAICPDIFYLTQR